MEFKINPGAFSGIFPVPTAIVDDNIRLASVTQLKVILYLLRHCSEGNLTSEAIANALMMDVEDVKDALISWKERGIVIAEDEKPSLLTPVAPATPTFSATPTAPEIKTEIKERKKADYIPVTKPDLTQVAKRLEECHELKQICHEAEAILGKTVGYDGMSTIIMLYDTFGLNALIIPMLIEYCVNGGHTGFAHIGKVGRIWSELEIDTFEAAEAYIKEHDKIGEVWDKLRTLTDFNNKKPTAKQEEYLSRWINTYGYDTNIIYAAYEDCVDYTGKVGMRYMDKILTTWYEKGVKTLLDVAREKQLWKEQQAKKYEKKPTGKAKEKAEHEKREASYDIDKFMQKAVDLKYDKNDKNE